MLELTSLVGYGSGMIGRTVLTLALILAACDNATPSAPQGGLTDRQFIEVYIELRNAHLKARTPQEFARLEQQILSKAGATRESLKQFLTAHDHDLAYMATVWDSIRTRIDAAPLPPK